MAVKVSGLALKRDGSKVSASWKISTAAKSATKRMTVSRKLDRVGKTDSWKILHDGGVVTGHSLSFDRSAYYPYSGKPKLRSIGAAVRCYGKDGTKHEAVTETKTLGVPYKPSSLEVSLASDNSTLTATAKVPNDTSWRERYDTVVLWQRRDYASGKLKDVKRTTGKGSTVELSTVVADANGLADDQWIELVCTAYSRGLAGDGAKRTASHVFGRPA